MYDARTLSLQKYDHVATVEKLLRKDGTVHASDIPCLKERNAFTKWCARKYTTNGKGAFKIERKRDNEAS